MKAPDIESRVGSRGKHLVWTAGVHLRSFWTSLSRQAFLVREGPFRWNVLSSFHAHWLPALSLFHIRRSTRKPYSVFPGVTPGLKAFPSSLIDNNALARTFLPGRADTTPPLPWISIFRHPRKSELSRGNGGAEGRLGNYRVLRALDSADRWRGGYDRQQSWLSVNSLPFCVTVDERSPSYSTLLKPSSRYARLRRRICRLRSCSDFKASLVVWLQFSVKQHHYYAWHQSIWMIYKSAKKSWNPIQKFLRIWSVLKTVIISWG